MEVERKKLSKRILKDCNTILSNLISTAKLRASLKT
jgi:hypothetical protein